MKSIISFLFCIVTSLLSITTLIAQSVDPIKTITGAEILLRDQLEALKGKRIGLVVNHTALIDSVHLIDLLRVQPGITLHTIFAPEHGIRGTADAGALIKDEVDVRSGLPIRSLHGEVLAPTPAMLESIDLLLFDMQDVGTRFYTYISTLGLVMQAAAKAGIPLWVLDRPNPIAPLPLEGFLWEPQHRSFIGMYPMPVTHGMTMGEIATMIRGEHWLEGLEGLKLQVIPMEGWNRSMFWDQTGLPWIPPSPNLPTFESALMYPGTCFFGSTIASEGRGTYHPFTLIGAPWLSDAQTLLAATKAYSWLGVTLTDSTYTIQSIPGMAQKTRFNGQSLRGVSLKVQQPHYSQSQHTQPQQSQPQTLEPLALGMQLMKVFYDAAPDSLKASFFLRQPMLNVSGTDRYMSLIQQGAPPETIKKAWQNDVEAFLLRRKPYLIYP